MKDKNGVYELTVQGLGTCLAKGTFDAGNCYVQMCNGHWLKVSSLADVWAHCDMVHFIKRS